MTFWKVGADYFCTEDEDERRALLKVYPAAVPMTEDAFYSTVAAADDVMILSSAAHDFEFGEVELL